MTPDLTGVGDPLQMADADAQAAAGIDPAAIVDAAVQSGEASARPVRGPTPPEVADSVRRWWDRTAETADFRAAVDRTIKDRQALDGGTPAEVEDASSVTAHHIYRNALQGVALCSPDLMKVEWGPRSEAKPLPGMPMPPELMQRKQQQMGLASVVTVLFQRFGEDANLQEKIEAWVQDSFHFRMAIVKLWFQRSLSADPISVSRLPDEQDLVAKARVLIELYDQGEFTKHDAQYQDMRDALNAIGRTEMDVKRGIMVELIPLTRYRCDPSVTGPEYLDSASWESNDIPMTRDDILAKWDHITADDLAKSTVYQLDETGRMERLAQQERTKTVRDAQSNLSTNMTAQARKGDDWLLVREIFDYESNTRRTLVEGLDFPAAEEPIELGPSGMSPFVVLVENRRSGSLPGFSDTELQDKMQRQLNRMRSQEEDARRNARPRWGANASAFPFPEDLTRAQDADPNTVTMIRTSSAKALAEEIIPLAGNHEFNPMEFDGTKTIQEMRKMAMLPEQASGELGNAEFATEVQVAAAGANALARYRQTRIRRAITKLCNKIAQLILLNVPQELAIRYAGPLAAVYYPPNQLDRREVYDGLQITVDVALDRQLDYNRRLQSFSQLLDSLGKLGMRVDQQQAAALLAKFADLGIDGERLVQADPNELVGRLAQALQEQPQGMAPEAMLMLAQLGQMAQQQIIQAAAAQQPQPVPAAGQAPGLPPGA